MPITKPVSLSATRTLLEVPSAFSCQPLATSLWLIAPQLACVAQASSL
ncbi:MAG: hypothetical protein F6J98_04510 [Moorea sp. SIO4G2]|nr:MULTISPECIES: hypothetical protein [unclassified Moorena]NEO22372.1 hypothetical protein [Moorena sp. SIO4A5]NEO59706.1 hypothetical protein [Moorena sp. SIO4G2]NEQ61056.1 hypothetical protein [Moorena sp. SIO4A1]